MVLAAYKPTRSALLQLRKTRKLAERGHRLLKLKQDALIVEFFKVLERAKTLRSDLVNKYVAAQRKISVASAVEGGTGGRSGAYAWQEGPAVDLKTKNVMGIG